MVGRTIVVRLRIALHHKRAAFAGPAKLAFWPRPRDRAQTSFVLC